jgi:ABC-type nickel/cobalt efflux system permease component RcnA
MDWLIAAQRALYAGMAENMRAASNPHDLPLLVAVAFLFGMVHALMPGHGKTVLVSYHLGRRGRLIEGVATGTLLAATHVGVAVVFVLAGIAVISRSVAAAGRAPAFEVASAVLIALIGIYLLMRTLWPSQHQHPRDGKVLAVVTGLVPCPLTIFILTYALARGKLATGFAAVGGMLGGVILTLVSFAVAAVVARQRFLSLLTRTEGLRASLGWWMELVGALGVSVLGLTILARHWALL